MAKPQHDEPRAPLNLEELLEILVKTKKLEPARAQEIAGRATTLRSQVLKERVGSVRSQAAARYEASPAELVAAARLSEASNPKRTLDEDVIAEVIAAAADVPYLKIDPVKVNADLVTSTQEAFEVRNLHLPIAVSQLHRRQPAPVDPLFHGLTGDIQDLGDVVRRKEPL